MAPKVQGAWNLHTLTQAYSLDFFVLFSSSASLLGAPSQGNYAAANAFMDGLAHHRVSLGLPALSINWESWAEVGMAARLTASQQKRWAAKGMTTIPSKSGLQLFYNLLGASGQIGVLPIDWSLYSKGHLASGEQPLLAELVKHRPLNIVPGLQDAERADEHKRCAEERSNGTNTLRQQLAEAADSTQQKLLITHLQAEVAKVLGASQLPEPEEGFFEMGMDSLMTVELRNNLQATLDLSLPSTLAFEYPTIEQLAAYLLNEVLGLGDKAAKIDQTTDTYASDIEQLSASELEALIENEIALLIG